MITFVIICSLALLTLCAIDVRDKRREFLRQQIDR